MGLFKKQDSDPMANATTQTPPASDTGALSNNAITKTISSASQRRGSNTTSSSRSKVRKDPKKYKPIPGTNSLALFNPKLRAALHNPLITINWLHGLYGEAFKVSLLGRELTFLSSQRNVDKMLSTGKVVKEAHDFLRALRPAAGEGLFTVDNDNPNWGMAHRILMPAFGAMSVRNMYDDMVDLARSMITRWHTHQNEAIDIPDQLTRLTLDTISLCAFDYRFNSFFKEDMHPFIGHMLEFLTLGGRRAMMPINKVFNISQRAKFTNAQHRLQEFANEIIAQRVKEGDKGRKDLCHRMLNVADPETGEKLSHENICAQLLTFLVAGHETTSGLLSFALYYMVKNPKTMRKAQEEVDAIGWITQDSLTKMPYIDAILKEALRLQPTAPMFAVSSDEDVELPSGHLIQAGQPVFINLHGLHSDPAAWGPDPLAFRPERMLDGGFENALPNSWKPFGNGIRACIGRAFALQEAMLAIATIVQNFDLELVDPTYELRVKFSLTIKPDDMKMRVRRRVKGAPPVFPLMTWEKAEGRDMPSVPSETDTAGAGSRPVKILFGSNSGSCEALANDLGQTLSTRGFQPDVATLDSCLKMPTDEPVVIVTASYEGQPCDNARQFVAYLESDPQLKNVKYAVFGAGHHDWVDTYMNVPRNIDSKMTELGAERLVPRGEGDVAGDFIGEFESWKEGLLKELGADGDNSEARSVEYIPLTSKTLNVSANQGLQSGKVVDNVELAAASETSEAKRHITIELPEDEVYRTGDYISILPKNPKATVLRVLKRFNLDPDAKLTLRGRNLGSTVPVRAYDVLESTVELNMPVQRRLLATLASLCDQPKEKALIEDLDGDNYQEKVLERRLSTIDLLEQCTSCDLTFDQYINSLQALHQRQYSISSSPLEAPNMCTITIDILRGPSLAGSSEFQGVTSNYLADLKAGDELACAVRGSSNFHLPDNPETPIVCFAAGTGIAPFRGFFQERVLQLRHGRAVGETVLFYGCRTDADFLHKSEFEAWAAEFPDKIKVKNSFSRQEGSKHKYVQDRVLAEKDDVLRLFDAGASFYTCGSASKLSHSLRRAFKQMVEQANGESEKTRAQAFLDATSSSRYAVDIFT
ncbi:hypothetical protein PYCC9005_003515 [Savitreella phatthalungensis]